MARNPSLPSSLFLPCLQHFPSFTCIRPFPLFSLISQINQSPGIHSRRINQKRIRSGEEITMIGEFVSASLLLVAGYAYPAFRCFKTLEKGKIEVHQLRFWCQYWIILAVLTILEKVGDTLISWIPVYGEIKLALFIFLWYPKTKGTGFVYNSLLRPCVIKHEPEIERSLLEFRERACNLAMYFWENCTELGSTKFLHFLQSASSQSPTPQLTKLQDDECQRWMAASSSPPTMLSRMFKRNNPDRPRRPNKSHSS